MATRSTSTAVEVSPAKPGVYLVKWSAKEAGDIDVNVMLDGVHVGGSPFTYAVHATDDGTTDDDTAAAAGPEGENAGGGAPAAAAAAAAAEPADVVAVAQGGAATGDAPSVRMSGCSGTVVCNVPKHMIRAGASMDAMEVGEIPKVSRARACPSLLHVPFSHVVVMCFLLACCCAVTCPLITLRLFLCRCRADHHFSLPPRASSVFFQTRHN